MRQEPRATGTEERASAVAVAWGQKNRLTGGGVRDLVEGRRFELPTS